MIMGITIVELCDLIYYDIIKIHGRKPIIQLLKILPKTLILSTNPQVLACSKTMHFPNYKAKTQTMVLSTWECDSLEEECRGAS